MAPTGEGDCRSAKAPVLGGTLWLVGWLFTIGYLHLGLWKSVLGLLVWPYLLGSALAPR